MKQRSLPRSLSRVGGFLLVLLGLLGNPWTLEVTIVSLGSILGSDLPVIVSIVAVQVMLVALGIWLLIRAPLLTLPSLGNLMLLGLSVALSGVVLEVGVRLMNIDHRITRAYVGEYPSRQSKNFIEDPHTGWRLRGGIEFTWTIDTHEHTYRANREGYRSERDFETGHRPLICLAGDSFTFGTGVEYGETFGHLVDTALGTGVVHNYAQPGYGVDQIWMSVRHAILPSQPDLVVVGFIDDDFDRSLTAFRRVEGLNKPTFALEGGRLRPETAADIPQGPAGFLRSRLSTVRLVETLADRLPVVGRWWPLNAAILKQIADDCERAGVPVLFLRLPEKGDRPFARLARHMQRLDLNFIDLGELDPGHPSEIHFATDGHINAEGHRRIATLILDWLREHHPQPAESGP